MRSYTNNGKHENECEEIPWNTRKYNVRLLKDRKSSNTVFEVCGASLCHSKLFSDLDRGTFVGETNHVHLQGPQPKTCQSVETKKNWKSTKDDNKYRNKHWKCLPYRSLKILVPYSSFSRSDTTDLKICLSSLRETRRSDIPYELMCVVSFRRIVERP